MEPLSGDLEKSQPSTSQWFKANRHQMHLYQDSKILSRFHNRLGAAKTPTRMDHLVPCSSLASFVPPPFDPSYLFSITLAPLSTSASSPSNHPFQNHRNRNFLTWYRTRIFVFHIMCHKDCSIMENDGDNNT